MLGNQALIGGKTSRRCKIRILRTEREVATGKIAARVVDGARNTAAGCSTFFLH